MIRVASETSRGTAPGRLPEFLIVGAPRAGTTALSTYLGAHHEVFVPDRKELNYFDRDDPTGAGLQWYRNQFAGALAHHIAGEATPEYLFAPEAPARIAALLPNARLIALLRHPVDRAYSHYWLCRGLGYERRSFAEAVDTELAGEAAPGLEYLARGDYLPQLRRFRDHFPPEALFVRMFDELCSAPHELFSECCRHIGADAAAVPAIVGTRINAAQRQRSLALFRVLERWRNSRRPGFAVARYLAARNSRAFAPAPMEPHVRGRLVDHFESRIDALAQYLQRDLDAWRR